MPIFTHDRIDITAGIMSKVGVLWGGNAVQSITIGRHTPRSPQQAVGYLGIVDYTRGVITSDVSLDCVLTENTSRATANTSAYKFAEQRISVGVEEFVLTSISVGFSAGNPATVNYGYMTATIASSLAIQAQPSPRTGEQDPFAVVMGDDGDGIKITATGGTVSGSGSMSFLNPTTGVISTMTDGGIPAGLQNLNFNVRLNRDNILDVRSVLPCQFVTQYPIDLTADMELYLLPDSGSLSMIDELEIDTNSNGAGLSNTGLFLKAIGMEKVDEQETVSVGRYRGFTFNYSVADIQLPIEEPPAATLD